MKRYRVRIMQQREAHIVAPSIEEAARIVRSSLRDGDRLLEIQEVPAGINPVEDPPDEAA